MIRLMMVRACSMDSSGHCHGCDDLAFAKLSRNRGSAYARGDDDDDDDDGDDDK